MFFINIIGLDRNKSGVFYIKWGEEMLLIEVFWYFYVKFFDVILVKIVILNNVFDWFKLEILNDE